MTGAEAEAIYARAMMGYLTHPLVRCAVLLEHGCEKTHNDYLRNELAARGLAAEDYGWASVQLDGGIDKVSARRTGSPLSWIRSLCQWSGRASWTLVELALAVSATSCAF